MRKIVMIAASVFILVEGCAALPDNGPPQSGVGSPIPETPECSEEQAPREVEDTIPLDMEALLERYRIDEEAPSLIRVDPGLIRTTDEILYGPESLERSMVKAGHITDSHAVTRSISYLDRWCREFERYYPRFSDELPAGEGAEVVKAHYQKMYEAALEEADRYAADAFARVEIDSPMQWQHYNYQNYSGVNIQGNYLSVVYDWMDYIGGAHMMYGSWAENFDLATGKLLAREDIIAVDEESLELLQALLEACADPENDFMWGTSAVVHAGNLYFSDSGITFLFNPYESGTYASGLREITVPYEELAPFLLLDLK